MACLPVMTATQALFHSSAVEFQLYESYIKIIKCLQLKCYQEHNRNNINLNSVKQTVLKLLVKYNKNVNL
jgi:hypothetical protein